MWVFSIGQHDDGIMSIYDSYENAKHAAELYVIEYTRYINKTNPNFTSEIIWEPRGHGKFTKYGKSYDYIEYINIYNVPVEQYEFSF